MTMVLIHLQKTTTQGHCGAKVALYHLTVVPRLVTCGDCAAVLKRTRPVHLTGAPCGGAGPETAVRREITCDACKLEGEPARRPEYRADAGIRAEDRNTPPVGISIAWDRLGARNDPGRTYIPGSVVRMGTAAIARAIKTRYNLNPDVEVTVDLAGGVVYVAGGKYGSGHIRSGTYGV